MTTPNEELISMLLAKGCPDWVTARWLMESAADLLQSQAERIKELEGDVEYLQKDIDAMCNAIPSYRWSGGAAELITKCFAERDTLRAQLAAIRAQEPVLVVEKEPDYWSGGHFHEGSKPHIKPTKVWCLPIGTQLFTHPMPAQDVTELVEALERLLESTTGVDQVSTVNEARTALSKYKGAK